MNGISTIEHAVADEPTITTRRATMNHTTTHANERTDANTNETVTIDG
ncbi:hypothetical protein [Natronorubrum sp. DTA28]